LASLEKCIKGYSLLGTKLFDYLVLRRKIILCYKSDDDAMELKKKYYKIMEFKSECKCLQQDIIIKTNSGIIIKDEEHLYRSLKELHMEFNTKGFIECNSLNTEQFSRKIQVEKLVKIINKLI